MSADEVFGAYEWEMGVLLKGWNEEQKQIKEANAKKGRR